MTETENFKLLNSIAQLLVDKKGFNIMALDVRGIANMTDYFLIVEGGVDRHVSALGAAVVKELAEKGMKPVHVEGLQLGDWVVLDYVDFVIHIFLPAMRDKYRLEQLWCEGKLINLKLKLEVV